MKIEKCFENLNKRFKLLITYILIKNNNYQ